MRTRTVSVIALVLIAAGLIFGLTVFKGLDNNSTPFVTAILGMIATTIPAVLALDSADKARLSADSIGVDIRNGVLKNKVAEALTEHYDKVTEPGIKQIVTDVVTQHDPSVPNASVTFVNPPTESAVP